MTKARDLADGASALSAVSATELGYLDGVTSAVQTQINTKLASSTAATTYQAINTNVSTTELGYLDGVTSAIQTQLNQKPEFVAGKNVLVNSDFKINQRNTGLTTTSSIFVVDRFSLNYSGGSCSGEQKTFSPGAGITGISSVENYLEYISSGQSGTSDFMRCRGTFEDVYTFAGETVTFSFYAKAATGTPKIAPAFTQNFGSGGSASVTTKAGEVTLSTSWARYSVTFTMPSISGKTIGANNYNTLQLFMSAGSAVDSGAIGIGVQNNTFQFTALQLEAGSVATGFQTATGTVQGELLACQRYYYRQNYDAASSYAVFGFGWANTASDGYIHTPFLVKMRTKPASIDTSSLSNFAIEYSNAAAITSLTSLVLDSNYSSSDNGVIAFNKTSAFTINQQYRLNGNANSGAYIGWSAEL